MLKEKNVATRTNSPPSCSSAKLNNIQDCEQACHKFEESYCDLDRPIACDSS